MGLNIYWSYLIKYTTIWGGGVIYSAFCSQIEKKNSGKIFTPILLIPQLLLEAQVINIAYNRLYFNYLMSLPLQICMTCFHFTQKVSYKVRRQSTCTISPSITSINRHILLCHVSFQGALKVPLQQHLPCSHCWFSKRYT